MKKFETLGKKLSKEEQKVIAGGVEGGGCPPIGSPCRENVYCCSNDCGDCFGQPGCDAGKWCNP